MSTFSDKVDEIASLVKSKNIAYGNSFGTAGEALKILYPEGIKPNQYPDALLVARIWDKLKRIATDNDPFGESPFVDIAGYAICGSTLKEEKKSPQGPLDPNLKTRNKLRQSDRSWFLV